MERGRVLDIQRFSVHDGPGIRTTVFLKGCPLRCTWCHNPESQSARPAIVVMDGRCIACGACRDACPQAAGRIRGAGAPRRHVGSAPEQARAERAPHEPSRAASPLSSFMADEELVLPSGVGDGCEGSLCGVRAAQTPDPGPRLCVPSGEGAWRPSPDECTVCGSCLAACPTGARRLLGAEMTVDDVLREVLRDRIFFDDSGGGVTFSGGEPFAQSRFLLACLAACREAGVHTAVDTCGLAARADLLAAAALTDLFLFDLKLMDEAAHIAYTGVSNAAILANLKALAKAGARIRIRIPVIPGVNDDAAGASAAAELLAALPGVRQVDLLPYHRIGMHKFARLGRPYELADVAPPSPESLDRLAGTFRAAGLVTRIGG